MRRTALLLAVVAVAGCRTGRNYITAEGPRYAGAPSQSSAGARPASDTLRLVSFNIEFSQQVDSAMAVLASDPALRGADVLLLQEMNAEATKRIAGALGLWYVYYPAFFHYRTDQDVGNAVLSRWPTTRPISAPWETWHPLRAGISCALSSRMPSTIPVWSSAAT